MSLSILMCMPLSVSILEKSAFDPVAWEVVSMTEGDLSCAEPEYNHRFLSEFRVTAVSCAYLCTIEGTGLCAIEYADVCAIGYTDVCLCAIEYADVCVIEYANVYTIECASVLVPVGMPLSVPLRSQDSI